MFCPECGHRLPDQQVLFCPDCGTRIIIPEQPTEKLQTAPITEPQTPETPTRKKCKRSTAALLLGVGTYVFSMLTLLCRLLGLDLRILYATAAATFFLAPLACCFGLLGIIARAKHSEKRGLPSAIIGLLLGLVFGLLAAYCLIMRVFRA